MTKDVYSGDDSLSSNTERTLHRGAVRYAIIGDAHPDLLLKVSAQLLLSNELPRKLTLIRQIADQATIEVEFIEIGSPLAESLRRKLSQLSCVESVILSFE